MTAYAWRHSDLAMVLCSDGERRRALYDHVNRRWFFADGTYRLFTESDAVPCVVIEDLDSRAASEARPYLDVGTMPPAVRIWTEGDLVERTGESAWVARRDMMLWRATRQIGNLDDAFINGLLDEGEARVLRCSADGIGV